MKMDKKARAAETLKRLKKAYPRAKIALKFGNNIQMLVAVVLSAHCTDKKVNEVTKPLFRKYKTARDFACANPKTFEQEIRSTGFYRVKAKNIIAASKIIVEKFGGKLPRTMEDMLTLPGVARKTANIVLGNAYGVVEGIAVDTHVRQFANYCGLSAHHDPVKIERDLMKSFPKKDWFKITYMIIDHGRALRANKKSHVLCGVCKLCPGFLK